MLELHGTRKLTWGRQNALRIYKLCFVFLLLTLQVLAVSAQPECKRRTVHPKDHELFEWNPGTMLKFRNIMANFMQLQVTTQNNGRDVHTVDIIPSKNRLVLTANINEKNILEIMENLPESSDDFQDRDELRVIFLTNDVTSGLKVAWHDLERDIQLTSNASYITEYLKVTNLGNGDIDVDLCQGEHSKSGKGDEAKTQSKYNDRHHREKAQNNRFLAAFLVCLVALLATVGGIVVYINRSKSPSSFSCATIQCQKLDKFLALFRWEKDSRATKAQPPQSRPRLPSPPSTPADKRQSCNNEKFVENAEETTPGLSPFVERSRPAIEIPHEQTQNRDVSRMNRPAMVLPPEPTQNRDVSRMNRPAVVLPPELTQNRDFSRMNRPAMVLPPELTQNRDFSRMNRPAIILPSEQTQNSGTSMITKLAIGPPAEQTQNRAIYRMQRSVIATPGRWSTEYENDHWDDKYYENL